jgi:rubrerythrin
MHDDLTLHDLDRDGRLGESMAEVHGATRAGFLTRAALGGGALLAALALPPAAADAQSSSDVSILNYALALEELQAAFYTEVERIGALEGELARQATVVGAHERGHVTALRDVLGKKAAARGHYDFRGATEDSDRFRRTAVAFEDLAVAAYKAQAPRVRSAELLVSVLAIHSVEARHAAWIRRLAGVAPAANAFDDPLGRTRVLEIVDRTNFVVQNTASRQRPRFTG